MAIQFGIFDHIERYGDEPVEEVFEGRIKLLKRAEEGGFYAFHLSEHHGHRYSMSPSAAVFLTALARETTTLKLIPTVVCLPLHHPVRLFEEMAMLDALSHGRLELGIGKGITPFEHLMFGHDPEEGGARTREVLGMLLKAWETGIMSSEGSEYYDFLEMELPFERVQLPYPQLWTAGNVETAGRGGHNFIFPMPIPIPMRDRYEELRAASREEPGHQNPHVTEPRLAQSQGVVIARTDEEAVAIARRAWEPYKNSLLRSHGTVPPHLQVGLPDSHDGLAAQAAIQGDPLEKQLVIAGSVETVREYFVNQARRGVANYFILSVFGDQSHDEIAFTVEAYINDIIPAVRAVESEAARA